MWYCACCRRYHTRLTSAYGFDGWKMSGKTKAKDSLCMKGVFFDKGWESMWRKTVDVLNSRSPCQSFSIAEEKRK